MFSRQTERIGPPGCQSFNIFNRQPTIKYSTIVLQYMIIHIVYRYRYRVIENLKKNFMLFCICNTNRLLELRCLTNSTIRKNNIKL